MPQPMSTPTIFGTTLSVTVIVVPDCAGGLAPVLETIADGELSIEYMYSLFTHREGKAYMVFRMSDEEMFAKKLAEHGMHPATKEELGLQ